MFCDMVNSTNCAVAIFCGHCIFTSGQLAASGLPFYGLAPYQNHLPLDHPENAAAVAWLTGDGVDGAEDDSPVGGGGPEGDGSARTLSRWVFRNVI